MFDKYRANEITKVYMEKYAGLKHLLHIRDNMEEMGDDDLKITSMLNVYVEPTNRCNLNCIFCARENMKRDFEMLKFDTFMKAVDGLPRGSYITFTGNGEPTLNVDVYDMIRYASDKGMFVSIITNACALNESNRKKLINSGVSRIQLSFEALDKNTNEKIMRGSVYEKQLLNMLLLIKDIRDNDKKIYICISRVNMQESAQFADVTKKFWEKMPIDNYYEGAYLSMQTDSAIYEKTEITEEYRPCANPWIAVKVNASGTVNPCALDWSSKFIVGNVNDSPLPEILNSPKAIEFRKAVLAGNMDYLDEIGYGCKNCNTWTKCVKGDIAGVMEGSLPIRLGLVINEIAGDKPANTEFLNKAIALLESGETDLINTLMRTEE